MNGSLQKHTVRRVYALPALPSAAPVPNDHAKLTTWVKKMGNLNFKEW